MHFFTFNTVLVKSVDFKVKIQPYTVQRIAPQGSPRTPTAR